MMQGPRCVNRIGLALRDFPSSPVNARRLGQCACPKSCNRRHHSMISVACTRSVLGTVRLSAFAVLRLTTRSNLVGSNTGKSAGFSP